MNPTEMSNDGAYDPLTNGIVMGKEPRQFEGPGSPMPDTTQPSPDGKDHFQETLGGIQIPPEELRQGRRSERKRKAWWAGIASATAVCTTSLIFLLLNQGDQGTIQDIENQNAALRKKLDEGDKAVNAVKAEEARLWNEMQRQSVAIHDENCRRKNIDLRLSKDDENLAPWRAITKEMPLAD